MHSKSWGHVAQRESVHFVKLFRGPDFVSGWKFFALSFLHHTEKQAVAFNGRLQRLQKNNIYMFVYLFLLLFIVVV